MASRVLLCLNSGSSSLKFALYQIGDGEEILLAQGAVERNDAEVGRLWIHSAQRKIEKIGRDISSTPAALRTASAELEGLQVPRPDAVGHRLVHGGPHHAAPERITDKLVEELRSLIPFAPLHLPDEIAGIEAITAHFSSLPQVACFDTAFHRSMPEVAQRFALPRALWDEGIRRYGFHGISYEYIMGTLGVNPPSRLIIAHLGNGASMAAVKNGSPLDTTMGFTPAGGLMMGTRSGDLDPGIILYLLNKKPFDAPGLAELVNHQSGLLGVSGVSADMRDLLERESADAPAAEAIALFCYQARKYLGALVAALGGLDTLVFTGGIGEHAAPVRTRICAALSFLGIELDPLRNTQHAPIISR